MFTFIIFLILAAAVWGGSSTIFSHTKSEVEKTSRNQNSNDRNMGGYRFDQSKYDKADKTLKFYTKIHKFVAIPLSTLFIIAAIISTSIISVSKDNIKLFNKRILGASLADGKIIATNGEMGPQAWSLREGYHLMLFSSFKYDTTEEPILHMQPNQVGKLVAKDGLPLNKDEYFAPDWKKSVPEFAKSKIANKNTSEEDKAYYNNILNMSDEDIEKSMLDPVFFLKNGGKKGPQFNVLKPGKYPINTFLWSVQTVKATVINAGEVGVVTSRYGHQCDKVMSTGTSELTAPLVDKGCIGIWKETLSTGNYYFNTDAIRVSPMSIRVQAWAYRGGYTPREVDVAIGEGGKIEQKTLDFDPLPVPEGSADAAIQIKTKDKWRVFVEIRMQVQPEPEYASGIYASVGGLAQIENRGITPALQSVLRNMGERYQAKAFIENRSEIEAEVEKLMIFEGKKYGISIKEVRFGHIDVEPAVMTPGKIKQLSTDLKIAYIEQETTFKQLVKTNEIKATADQQKDLVKAKIQSERSDYQALAREKIGIGEEKYMKALARGQEAQKNVIGEDKTYQLQVIKLMTELCADKPQVCSNVPVIYSSGSGGADSQMLESFGALGLQNIIKAGEQVGRTSNKKD